jgi:glycosyltransferase involved in cell wall biosynthesis
MRRWAGRSDRVLVLSAGQIERATRLLGIDRARCVVAPNGFDPTLFAPREVDRAAVWRRTLVDEPRGWGPGGEEGSVAYRPEEVEALAHGVVYAAVGRFTAVKRLPLLIRAFTAARSATPAGTPRPSLVLVGGHPGEWEGEHPWDVIRATDARGVFLAGWHEHHELADLFRAADAVVLASVAEQFGLVLVEGMACGLPAIAVDRHGPSEIVEPGRTGWLVEPDDAAGLAAALTEAAADSGERARRGAAARAAALDRWSWPALGARVAAVLEEAAAGALTPTAP